MRATSKRYVVVSLFTRSGLALLGFGWLIACSSSSRNPDPSASGGGTAGLDGSVGGTGGSSGTTVGGSGGSGAVEPDAASGGSAGTTSDAGPKFDAGACTGDPLIEYDFAICGGGCLSSGLCATAPTCGTDNVCSFEGYDVSGPVEYFLPFEGVCSGKLVFTAQGNSGAKIEFFGVDSDTGNEVVLATLTSQPCITPGLKSFALPAPATKVILSVPSQTTAYLDDVVLNH